VYQKKTFPNPPRKNLRFEEEKTFQSASGGRKGSIWGGGLGGGVLFLGH